MAAMLADPAAPGRAFVLHATDEIVSEFAIEPYAANAPLHVTAIRTPKAKYAIYSQLDRGRNRAAEQEGQERELYDYRTPPGASSSTTARAEPSGGAPTSARTNARCARSCTARCPASSPMRAGWAREPRPRSQKAARGAAAAGCAARKANTGR